MLLFYSPQVNNDLRQIGSTSGMHFKIPEMLAYLSDYVTLFPGDLILTGTPEGVGPVRIGDKLKANILQQGKEVVQMNYSVEKLEFKPKF